MALLEALLSAVVWGSGQLLNKQYAKAAFFFFIQLLFVGIELNTGSWAVITRQAEAHFRNSGMFTRGIWGLVTLGEIERTTSAVLIFDHSTMLMVSGLIAITVMLFFIAIYVWNIRDAYHTRIKLTMGSAESSLQYFKRFLTGTFEYIAIAPGVIIIVFFSFIPIIFVILTAFTNYNTHTIPPRHLVEWVGFQTFRNVFNVTAWNRTLIGVFGWTVAWAFIATFTSFIAGFVQALILSSKLVKFPKIWRGLFIIPWAVPTLLSALLFRNFFVSHGVVNTVLIELGMIEAPMSFFGSVMWSRLILIFVNIWLGFPYFMALISGIMSALNQEIYEAASIDGASSFQQIKSLTIPSVVAAIAPLIIMSAAHNFNNFNLIFFITEGGPSNVNFVMAGSTDLLITWVFRLTMDHRMFNVASVMSVFIFAVVASVSVWRLRRTRAFSEE